MKTTLIVYILIGALFLVPLFLFNIRRIFVRKPPAPMKINGGRAAFVLLFSAFLVFFLVNAYHVTISSRYEIIAEKIADMHAQMRMGQISVEEFQTFVKDNGTELVGESLEHMDFSDETNQAAGPKLVRFQLGNRMTPNYWEKDDAFPKAKILGDESPIYLLYKMEQGSDTRFYTLRLRQIDGGWQYDWLGNATQEQIDSMNKGRYLPNEKNGKWYIVKE